MIIVAAGKNEAMNLRIRCMSLCSLSSRLGYGDIAPPGLRTVHSSPLLN
jgi:hypothetical protein